MTLTSGHGELLKGNSQLNTSPEISNHVSGNPVFVLREKHHLYYETRPVPVLPSENHVLVAVGATGLCGSDVCLLQRSSPSTRASSMSADLERGNRSTTGAMERLATSKFASHSFSAMSPQV
jgi:hypothetical protein